MKQINKEELLRELKERIESHITTCEKTFYPLTTQTLNESPLQGGWSIVQCLDHLNSYNQYYIPQIKILLEQSSSTKYEMADSSWLGRYFIKMMDPDNQVKKYKAAKKHLPEVQLDALAVLNQFIHWQETLLILLDTNRTKDMNKGRIPISISKFIKLTLADTLRFLIVHNERHMRQAKNIIKK